MSVKNEKVVYDGSLIRVVEVDVGLGYPYQFAHRMGCVAAFPVIDDPAHGPMVLTIENEQLFYGTVRGLPGGNLNGDHDNPELPLHAVPRELEEEIGYGFPAGSPGHIDLFELKQTSATMIVPNFWGVVRHPEKIRDPDNDPIERVTLSPTPLDLYVDQVLSLQHDEVSPQVCLAFAKTANEIGHDALVEWLSEPHPSTDSTLAIAEAFHPWLLYQEPVQT